ncbi:death-associated protein kinase 1-like [Amphiura filiformis]|uniref:death-associated protein kinase 1-like n=1 Tax=Amphiura filiformis TaxID=82378 RepID=UPI003B226537
MDQVEDKKTGHLVAKLNQTKMRCLFQESLDIVDSVITVNACNATDQGFGILKEILKQMAADILGTRMLPMICQNILDQMRRWYIPSYPVLPWTMFFEKVTEIAGKQIQDIESMMEESTVRTVAAYLHDMGEIYVAKDDNGDDDDEESQAMVIMNIQWLCSNVIAKMLAGDEFPAQFQKLPDKPLYSKDELRKFLSTGEGLGFDFTVLLLEHLKILFTTDDGSYLIPSKLPPSLPPILIEKSDNAQLYGIRVECADESDMFSPDLFPNIHLHMLECYPKSQGKTNYSNSAVKFISPVEGMVQLTDMGRAINVAVMCKNNTDRPEAYSQLQSLKKSIHTYLRQCSPGTIVTWKFLSPKSLKTEYNLEKVLYYESDDLHKAEAGNGTVYHSRQAHADNMIDVICQGVDMTFITELGGLSGWEGIPLELQQRI